MLTGQAQRKVPFKILCYSDIDLLGSETIISFVDENGVKFSPVNSQKDSVFVFFLDLNL